ncbi:MAG: DUF262 domain-containing protein [Gemmataceae bacterium]
MAAQEVNLDALIPREDFEAIDKDSSPNTIRQTLTTTDLEEGGFFYESLRKPDFQRETASWAPEKVADLIKCYVAGDLIPAVILWRSQSHIFVIDGAHRLGALIAWVHDDYGDNTRSHAYFGNVIPPEQKEAADKTRALIKKSIGTFKEHQLASGNPSAPPELRARAKLLGSLAVQIQWVSGDSYKAEDSFFRINQEAAPIDKTELLILRSRATPSAIAARAIVRSATGHKYWKKSRSIRRRSKVQQLRFTRRCSNPH